MYKVLSKVQKPKPNPETGDICMFEGKPIYRHTLMMNIDHEDAVDHIYAELYDKSLLTQVPAKEKEVVSSYDDSPSS